MYNRTYTGKIELAVLDTTGTFCDGPGEMEFDELDDLQFIVNDHDLILLFSKNTDDT